MIGDNIEISVVHISGNKIRLGITAPKDIVVDRKEVHQRKQEEASQGNMYS